MNARRWAVGFTATLLLLVGCNELEYTQDGVPIVPFGTVHGGDSTFAVGEAQLGTTVECWLNFMPGPRPDRAGIPFRVALRVAVMQADSASTWAHLEALTLWSEAGDAMLGSFALVNTRLGKAEVALQRQGITELTNDPNVPRRGVIEPGFRCAPRLLLETQGKRQIVSLSNITVQAVY